jgi:two-component system, OmpR family, sensor histidine kinase KdpD
MMAVMDLRRSPEELLRELGGRARLTLYVASAPGAGKTRRLLEDARRMHEARRRVAIGWIDTKGRPDLERLKSALPSIPPRAVRIGDATFEDFDYDAAVRAKPDVVILDELAHENLGEAAHAKRWQDALALRDAGISVIGAVNIQHVETVAAAAERLIGYPVREIVPFSFLQAADEVIALDVSPRLLQSRVRSGKIVNEQDIERALSGVFKEQTLSLLRELLLQTVDRLTLPAVKAAHTSNAIAFVTAGVDPQPFLRRSAAIAHALDLAFEVIVTPAVDPATLERPTREVGGELLRERIEPGTPAADELAPALVALPSGKTAARFANAPLTYDLFIAGTGQTYLGENAAGSPYSGTVGDRMRVGYGRLTVYLGPAAGAGKTYAMLDRAHQLVAEGTDVVAAFVETHGRAETAALLDGLDVQPPRTVVANGITYWELDRDAVIARRPQVALIDELAHTNAPDSIAPKRFQDVLAVLREGIDVVTTLNIQHLEGLGDTVQRLTGTNVRETLPDGILALADEIVLVDITPDALRERLRDGKIYPLARVDAALAGFFRRENLFALRELALREALRSRYRERVRSPFDRLLVGVGSREVDVPMIRRASRIAARLAIEFAVAHVVPPNERGNARIVEALRNEARKTNADWIEETAPDVPARLLEIARRRPETTIAVAGTRRKPRWPQAPAFARRLLDAGARELLVLVPATTSAPDAPE